MSLKGIFGGGNHKLLWLAAEKAPVLFIDAANCADIHQLRDIPLETLSLIYVLPAESLYRFKPTLRQLPGIARKVGTDKIIISTFTKLFDYDDEEENKDVFETCWRLIYQLSRRFEIVVGVGKGHEEFARRYGVEDMGHTISSPRVMTDLMLEELKQYGKTLGVEDNERYKRLLKEPLKRMGSISNASSFHVWAFLLLSIILEQDKRIEELEKLK